MEQTKPLSYLLCPKCQRTLPAASKERYCPNDGSRMLTACPHCNAAITSPYSRFCTACGEKLFVDMAATFIPVSITPKGEKGRRKI